MTEEPQTQSRPKYVGRIPKPRLQVADRKGRLSLPEKDQNTLRVYPTDSAAVNRLLHTGRKSAVSINALPYRVVTTKSAHWTPSQAVVCALTVRTGAMIAKFNVVLFDSEGNVLDYLEGLSLTRGGHIISPVRLSSRLGRNLHKQVMSEITKKGLR